MTSLLRLAAGPVAGLASCTSLRLANACRAVLLLGMGALSLPASAQQVAAPAENPAADQTLAVWMRDPIRTMDPQKAADPVSDQAIRLAFEGLYRPGPDGRPLPGVATGHSVSPDGLTWTFHLRPDARWGDGTPLVAADVVQGLRRLADPAIGSDGAWFVQFMGLQNAGAVVRGAAPLTDLGARAVDDRTLELRLTAPAPWLDKALMRVWTFPVPRAQIEAAAADGADWTAPGRLKGNGPFTLTGMDGDRRATFAPDPDWHDAARVRLSAITLLTGGPATDALARFEAGDLDLLAVPGPLYSGWAADRPDMAAALPRGCTNAIVVNLGPDAPDALKSPEVRRALSLAVDRDALVSQVVFGGQTPAWGWVPPSLAGFVAPPNADAALTQTARDAEALRLMHQAGFGGETPLRLTLRFNTSADHERIAQALRAAWRPLGVELRIVRGEWTDHAARLKAGDFHLARMGWCADVNDASAFLRYFAGNGPNPGQYDNATYRELVARAATAADPGPLQTQAAETLGRDLPMIPLYHYAAPLLIAPDLRGIARGDAMGGWSGQDIWRATE